MTHSLLRRWRQAWQPKQLYRARLPLPLVLTVPFVLLTVGTTGLVGYLCVRNGQKNVADFAYQLMTETGDRVNLYLNVYLETPQLVNRLNANAVRLGQLDITDPEGLKRHFIQQIQAFDSVSHIHFGNPQGGFVSAGNDDRGLSVASTANFVKGTLQVDAVDQQGNRREGLLVQPNYDASQRPFYQRAAAARKPVWTPIYVYVPASRGLGISASYPLYDEQQQLQGVLSCDLTLVAIHDFLKNLRVSPNGTVFIVDRAGRMVASSTSEKPFFTGTNSSEIEQLKAIESQDPPIRLSMQYLMEQFGALDKMNTAQQLQFDIAGKQQFLQITPFQDQFGLDWLIVVTVPESDFMERIDANTQNTILMSAAALTGSALLGLLMARWVARPIQQLSYASRALAAGAWQTSLQENSPIAELQVLTHAFNQTADQLSQTFDRVRTELQESEEKFTTVFRTCPDPISILTLDGQIVEVNDAFVELLGYSRAEIIGYQASDIGYWLSAAQQQQYLQALQAGERIRNQEYTFRKKTGELLTVWLSTEGIELQGQPCCLEVAKDITDRKQIEAALSQSESRIQRLAVAAPGAIYTLVKRCDESFYFEYISPAIEEINECTVGQMLNYPALDLIHPDDRHDYNRAVAQSAITLQAFSHEFRIITPSGKLKWLQASSRPERRQNGETAWYGIVLDISDRKRLELALQASEAKLSDIINSPIAAISRIVLFADQHWEIDFLSAGCEAVFGYTPQEFIDNKALWMDRIVSEDLESVILPLFAQIYTVQTLHTTLYEYRFRHKDGTLRWISSRFMVKRDESNNVWVLNQLALDITESKRAEAERNRVEAALRQSEATLRRAQQVAHVGSWQVDIQTEKVTWTEESFLMMGWDMAHPEPNLSQFYNLVHPDDRDLLRQQVEGTIAEQTAYRVEFRVLHPDGTLHYVEARGEVIVNEEGQVTHLIGTNLDITERKQSEEALRYSEATKNQILKAIPDLIIWMNAEGMCIDLIDGSTVTNLYVKSEAVGKNLLDILPPQLAQARRNSIQQALESGEVQVYEQQLLIEGEVRYEEVRVIGVGEDRILVIIRDITDRKRAEAALEAQRSFLRQVLDVIPNPVFVKDTKGRFIIANQAVANLHRVSIDELLGKRITEISPYVDHNLEAQFLIENQEVMQTRQPRQSLPYEMLTANGERRWYQTIISSFVNAEGQVQGVVGNSVDITGLKQVEAVLQQQNQALRESEERFRSAFWDAPIGMALIGLNDRWIKVNPMLCEMLGFSETELLAMPASHRVYPDDLTKFQHSVQQVVCNENRNVQVELRYCCQQGHLVWGLMSLSLVRDAQNQPLYCVAQIQDITERQAIDRMKNEFISIVSHELRTPLTAIRGFLGLLDTGMYDNKPDRAKHMISQALTNSERLVHLVNDILDLERLSSGRVQLVMEVCNTEVLMQRAIAGVQSLAEQASITLAMHPTTAQVWADPDTIIQTLTNLLSNGIKFSPAHSVITLAARSQSDSVLFSVADQGRGIPAEKLETIFERFQQVDVSDARQKGGTGLGLAICQSIVQQHGGRIWAESTFGEGSVFYFTLPVPPGGRHDKAHPAG